MVVRQQFSSRMESTACAEHVRLCAAESTAIPRSAVEGDSRGVATTGSARPELLRNNERCKADGRTPTIRDVSVAPHRELLDIPVECYRCKRTVRTIKILAIMAAGRDKLDTICPECRKSAPADRRGRSLSRQQRRL